MYSLRLLILGLVVSGAAQAADGGVCTVNPKGRYTVHFDRAELVKVIDTIAEITCKTIVLASGIEDTFITISTPKDAGLTPDQFFAVFVAAVEANGLKLVEKGGIVRITR
jgi:general secretion pathway protein D